MPQKVDPFIPVQSLQKPTLAQGEAAAKNIASPRRNMPKQNLERLRPWYNVQKPRTTPTPRATPAVRQQPASLQHPRQADEATSGAKPNRIPRLSRALRSLKYPSLAAVVLVAGLMLQIALVGEVLIAAYALFALIKRVESRTTFILALISFGYIILMLFVHSNPDLMKNFAMYAFLFLAIGAFSLLREAHY